MPARDPGAKPPGPGAPVRSVIVVRLRAVFFDLDDTIVESSWHDAAIDAVAERFAPSCGLPVPDIESAGRAAHEQVAQAVMADWNLGRITGMERGRAVWQEAFGSLGITEPSVIDAAAQVYWAAARKAFRAFPDVEGAVRQVRLAGLFCGIITNGAPDSQRGKLDALKLDHSFDVVVVSGELGVAKPDPAIFHRSLAIAGVTAEEAAHVGDSIPSDVAGAADAGLKAVWINRTGQEREHPGIEIHSLAQLARVLDYG